MAGNGGGGGRGREDRTRTDRGDVRLDSPVLAGALAALGALATGLAITVVPALVAQLSSAQGSLGVLGAILLALDALVLGHGGSLLLQAGSVTGSIAVMPFGLTIVLLVVVALAARRAVRRLRPISADGALRARALRDGGMCLGALVVVYTVGLGVLAAIARSTLVHAVVPSAVVSGALVSVVGGLAGALLALRRRGGGGIPEVRILSLLPAPYGSVARAVLLALAGLAASAALVCTAMIAVRFGAVASLHESLHAGFWGSVVLLLLQLALFPLIVVWVLVVILGGSVTLGAGSVISLAGAETTVMPALPLLGIVPDPGTAPWWTRLLLVLPVVAVALGAIRLCRDLVGEETDSASAEPVLRERVIALVAYAVALLLLVLLIAGLATGGIGDGSLEALGPRIGSLLLPLLGVVVVPTAAVAAVCLTPALPWARARWAGLRGRVEAAESRENGSESSHEHRAEGSRGSSRADRTDDEPAGVRDADASVRTPSDPPSS
ncbi:cell division protein PerM [Brachybacterium kimchii]|uniref:DUF6350 family protein n=1 Tax=Brachybacterium kimchii TaxID=2942909 RepID=A0ABY4N8L8_9MICO|nr:DUF6350 family protein [Brachybacterium kimchii]UQN29753.1 DUF6350 family protein [Brachybacterium kimchii]